MIRNEIHKKTTATSRKKTGYYYSIKSLMSIKISDTPKYTFRRFRNELWVL